MSYREGDKIKRGIVYEHRWTVDCRYGQINDGRV